MAIAMQLHSMLGCFPSASRIKIYAEEIGEDLEAMSGDQKMVTMGFLTEPRTNIQTAKGQTEQTLRFRNRL